MSEPVTVCEERLAILHSGRAGIRCGEVRLSLSIGRRRFLAGSFWALAGVLARREPFAWAEQRTIEVICREAWGARKPTGKFRHHRIKRLTVHHSGVKLVDNSKAPSHFRAHQASHQARGWPDIAYHVLIDRNGNVYEGRPISAVGDTATNYDPRGHLLVMCEGNFDEQHSSSAQVGALVDVLAWASERYGVGPRTIHGHRDYADTACPGDALYPRVPGIRRRVRRRLESGGVRRFELCGEAGADRVEDIEAGLA